MPRCPPSVTMILASSGYFFRSSRIWLPTSYIETFMPRCATLYIAMLNEMMCVPFDCIEANVLSVSAWPVVKLQALSTFLSGVPQRLIHVLASSLAISSARAWRVPIGSSSCTEIRPESCCGKKPVPISPKTAGSIDTTKKIAMAATIVLR